MKYWLSLSFQLGRERMLGTVWVLLCYAPFLSTYRSKEGTVTDLQETRGRPNGEKGEVVTRGTHGIQCLPTTQESSFPTGHSRIQRMSRGSSALGVNQLATPSLQQYVISPSHVLGPGFSVGDTVNRVNPCSQGSEFFGFPTKHFLNPLPCSFSTFPPYFSTLFSFSFILYSWLCGRMEARFSLVFNFLTTASFIIFEGR